MNYKKSVFNSQKQLKCLSKTSNELYVKAKFGPSKITRIPLKLCDNLAFFVATIIGDGHLKREKKQITIELSDNKLLEEIRDCCNLLFERKFNLNEVKQREGRKKTYCMCIDSKAIHNLLNQVFEIPIGRKSHIVKIPLFILDSTTKIKCAFLRGILVTEGGKRRRQYGMSTASKDLWLGIISLFNELKIPLFTDKWIYKKYKKEYYGIAFKPQYLDVFMRGCRSGQTE